MRVLSAVQTLAETSCAGRVAAQAMWAQRCGRGGGRPTSTVSSSSVRVVSHCLSLPLLRSSDDTGKAGETAQNERPRWGCHATESLGQELGLRSCPPSSRAQIDPSFLVIFHNARTHLEEYCPVGPDASSDTFAFTFVLSSARSDQVARRLAALTVCGFRLEEGPSAEKWFTCLLVIVPLPTDPIDDVRRIVAILTSLPSETGDDTSESAQHTQQTAVMAHRVRDSLCMRTLKPDVLIPRTETETGRVRRSVLG